MLPIRTHPGTVVLICLIYSHALSPSHFCLLLIPSLPQALFPKYKKWCDSYFFLPGRQEHRGTGGIFFDDLEALEGGGEEAGEEGVERARMFTEAVARSFMPSYLPRELVAFVGLSPFSSFKAFSSFLFLTSLFLLYCFFSGAEASRPAF